jgi:hypothetical protein
MNDCKIFGTKRKNFMSNTRNQCAAKHDLFRSALYPSTATEKFATIPVSAQRPHWCRVEFRWAAGARWRVKDEAGPGILAEALGCAWAVEMDFPLNQN